MRSRAVVRVLNPAFALALLALALLTSCSQENVAKVGQPAPAIAGTTLDGGPLTLSSLRGRPVIVNFWASWCVPCRQEMPRLQAFLAQYAADGLAIVGVIYKDSADGARDFARSFGATWPNVTDPDGSIARAYRVVAAPQSYFIDRAGILRSIQIGEILQEDFDRQYPPIAQ